MIPVVMPMHARQDRAAKDASIEASGMPLRAADHGIQGIQTPTRTTTTITPAKTT